MKKTSSIKNILYITPYFVPAWSYGGTVKVSFDFARELVALGNRVTVATTDALDSKSRNKKKRENIDGIDVIRFRNISNGLAKKFNLYAPVGFYKWLKQNINCYDVVHIHELFTYQSIITGTICRKLKKPYVIQPHGSLFRVARESGFSYIKGLVVRRFAALSLSCGFMIVLNKKEEEGVLSVYPEISSKIKIIPNGINLDEFKHIKSIDLHKQYGLPKENKIIAFLGRIKYVKGLDISLRSLALIMDRLNFSFLIIGPDEGEKKKLLQIIDKLGIKKKIVFAGLLSGNKKLETLKSADVAILNSRSEGLPTTLLESAALGLPIVCSRESNLPEVEKFDAGFIVDNEQQTAQKIELILNNGKLREKLSKNALRLAEDFDLKKCAKRLNEVYDSLI